jgi:hypothetical protein
MMNLSTSKMLRQIRTLQDRQQALLQRLLRPGELAVGTVSWVGRKCGQPGCHCAEGPGHRQMLFLFADVSGRRRCKFIRKADEARLEEANQRYREFRKDLRQLAAIQKRERALLMDLMQKRGLSYE